MGQHIMSHSWLDVLAKLIDILVFSPLGANSEGKAWGFTLRNEDTFAAG